MTAVLLLMALIHRTPEEKLSDRMTTLAREYRHQHDKLQALCAKRGQVAGMINQQEQGCVNPPASLPPQQQPAPQKELPKQ